MAIEAFKVSVIIPVYNAEKFIRKAVESALQHSEVAEIILVEDGSPDNSLKICEQLSREYSLVKLFQHERGINKGEGASRNLGILKSTQEYICFLDADDFFTEIRFEKEKEIFANNNAVDGVYGAIGTHYYDEIGASAWEKLGRNESTLTTVNGNILPEHLFEHLIGYNFRNYEGYFSVIAITLKRGKIFENNLFFDSKLRISPDTPFLFQCAYYLNLYTGEYSAPIAIRGVHVNNRYIHHQNFNNSNSKVYFALYEWSKRKSIGKIYIKHFRARYLDYAVGDKGIFKIIFSKPLLLISHYYHNLFNNRLGLNQ